MDILVTMLLLLLPVSMLALFIVSLIYFLKSPKETKERRKWKILTIVFGVIDAAILLYILVIVIMMMLAVRYM